MWPWEVKKAARFSEDMMQIMLFLAALANGDDRTLIKALLTKFDLKLWSGELPSHEWTILGPYRTNPTWVMRLVRSEVLMKSTRLLSIDGVDAGAGLHLNVHGFEDEGLRLQPSFSMQLYPDYFHPNSSKVTQMAKNVAKMIMMDRRLDIMLTSDIYYITLNKGGPPERIRF